MVPTATVLLGGPVNLQGTYGTMTVPFRPPPNVAGRTCYLRVVNASLMGKDHFIASVDTYYITMDLTQSMSYASMNHAIGGTTAEPGAFVCQDTPNQVVAMMTTGRQTGADTEFLGMILGEQPRILVDIPEGPQYVTINVYRGNGALVTGIPHLALFMEITPIDYGARPDLDI